MNIWLKRGFITLGVFAACWLGAVWYWQSTTRMPDTGDLALGLFAAPMGLLTGGWLVRQGLARAGSAASTAGAAGAEALSPNGAAAGKGFAASNASAAGAKDAAGAAPAASVAGNSGAADRVSAAATQPQLAILSAAVRMPHGSSPGELADAFESGNARLDLDPELTDMQGFPMLAGRVHDTDTAALTTWLSTQPPFKLGVHEQRALALGGAVAAQLVRAAMAHSGSTAGFQHGLHLTWLPPAGWNSSLQALASAWLLHGAASAGWPAGRITVATAAQDDAFSALQAIAGQVAQAAAATQPAHAAQATQTPGQHLHLLLAMDSSISDEAVARLSAAGNLYSQRQPNGLLPGEGAAALLLQRAALAPEAVQLLALQAGAPGTLADLARAALADARTIGSGGSGSGTGNGADSAIVHASSDTGHLSAAMMELMQCTTEVLPALDHASQMSSLGAACGHTGHAGSLAAIAVAWQHAAASDGYALCLGNNHDQQRHALVLGPAPAPTLI